MQKKISIPATLEEAKKSLTGVAALLQATEWSRAAIVHAFTTPGQPGPKGDPQENPRISFTEFAAQGIVGLTNRDTVADYHKAWQTAIDQGKAVDVKPGDYVVAPDLTWPPGTTSRRGSHGTATEAREYIARNPEVAVDAMKAVPAVADAVTTAIVEDNELHNTVARKAFAKSVGAKDPGKFAEPTKNIPDYAYDKEVGKAIGIVLKAIEDEESGAYSFDPGTKAQMSLLFLALKKRGGRYADAQPEVHGEIEEFLATTSRKED